MSITGNKDLDFLILNNLDDKDLLNFCLTKNNICDEEFWKKRTYSKFKDICKPSDKTWKQYYLYRLTHIVLAYRIDGVKITIEVDKNGEYSQSYLNTVKEIHKKSEEELKAAGEELKDDSEIVDLGARDLFWNLVHNIEDINEEGIDILSGEGDITDSQYLKGKHNLVEKFPELVYWMGKYEKFENI